MISDDEAQPSPSRRLGILGVGYSANSLQVWGFDYVLYPLVIWTLGLVIGGLVMTVLSCIFCYALIRLYDWSKEDWLGIETVKSLKESEAKSRIGRISSWILRKGDVAAFLFFSIKADPFITTLYMRRGNHGFNGLSSRDWKIFWGSQVVGNASWSFAVFTGVSFIEWLWVRL